MLDKELIGVIVELGDAVLSGVFKEVSCGLGLWFIGFNGV